MPCKYVIAQEGKVVVERWTGTVSPQELMAHKKQQALDPSIKENASVLSDCTSAVFALSPDDIGRISAMDTGPDKDSKITRYAFLVNDDTFTTAQKLTNLIVKIRPQDTEKIETVKRVIKEHVNIDAILERLRSRKK